MFKFLNELRSQDNEIYSVYFDFNLYPQSLLPYVPRLYLGDDILLHPAQILLVKNKLDLQSFKKYLWETIEKYSFTSKVSFNDSKGNLIIDLENEENVVSLFEKLKKSNQFYVSECLYDSFDPIVMDKNNNFSHEFVVSIKNTDYISKKSRFNFSEQSNVELENAPIVTNWLYFELYCNSYAENEVLRYIYDDIISKNKVEKFFFVRYNNPRNHLRVRFKTNSIDIKENIISKINQLKVQSLILKYHILPYEKEVYRYGGRELMRLTEEIFNIDSNDILVNILKEDLDNDSILIVSILKLKQYLEFFDFSLDEMILFCEKNIIHFSQEFNLNSDLKKSFNKDFSRLKTVINRYNYNNFLNDTDFKIAVKESLEKSNLVKFDYIAALIHMSMNRIFDENQKTYEFRTYYVAKCYLNQQKFTTKIVKNAKR